MKAFLISILMILAFALDILGQSTVEGVEWKPTKGLNLNVIDMGTNTTYLFASTAEGLFRTQDEGMTWERKGEPTWNIHQFSVIDSTIFAIVSDNTNSNIDFKKSTDNGNKWTSIKDKLPKFPVKKYDPEFNSNSLIAANKDTIFISMDEVFYPLDEEQDPSYYSALYYSVDDGDNWKINPPVPFNYVYIKKINQIKSNGDKLFVVGLSLAIPDLVYVSKDNGGFFTRILTVKNPIESIEIVGETILIGTKEGIFISEDGVNTRPLNEGLSQATGQVPGSYSIYSFTGVNTGVNKMFFTSANGRWGENILSFAAGDTTWRKADEGLFQKKCSVLKSHKNYIFGAMEENGVWRRPITDFFPPKVVTDTLDQTKKTGTTAYVTGVMNAKGYNTTGYFEFSTDSLFRIDRKKTTGLASSALWSDINVACTLDNLSGDTKYYYRLVGESDGGTRSLGSAYNFITLPETKISDFSKLDAAHATMGPNGKITVDPLQVSITLNQNKNGTDVKIFTKSYTRDSTNWKISQEIDSDSNVFTTNLPSEQFDQLGLEYYFQVSPSEGYGPELTSRVTKVRLYFPNGLPLPKVFGKTQQDYKMITIPLDLVNGDASEVFSIFGGDKTKWRLFRYNPEKAALLKEDEDKHWDETPSIEQAKSYWLINNGIDTTIFSGSGYSLRPDKMPVSITLKKGWNQIGNPYLLKLLWQDVLEYSEISNTMVSNPYVYSPLGYQQTDTLNPMEGVFVKNKGGSDLILKFPTRRNTELNGQRVKNELARYNEGSLFESNFSLSSKGGYLLTGGIGMHSQAHDGLDYLDEENPPRWANYLEVAFEKEGYRLSKDMASVKDEYIWEFEVPTNLDAKHFTLSWENYFGENYPYGKQLALYDLNQQEVIDMLVENSYSLTSEGRFKIVYGNPEFVKQNTLSDEIVLRNAYPNPATNGQTIVIPFSLPKSEKPFQVEIGLYDLQGKLLEAIAKGLYDEGHHEILWENRKKKNVSGIYLYKINVQGERNTSVVRKIIFQ